MPRTYRVVVIDMFHTPDPDEDITYVGFPTAEDAAAFARARVRDSIETLRAEGKDGEDLRSSWFSFGEDAVTDLFRGLDALDEFIASPATPAERDWESILTRTGARIATR